MYLCICKLYLPRTHAYLAAPHPVSSLELSAVCTFLTTDGVTIFIIIAITIIFDIIITTELNKTQINKMFELTFLATEGMPIF